MTVKKWPIYYQQEPFILKPISCFGSIKTSYNSDVIFHVTAIALILAVWRIGGLFLYFPPLFVQRIRGLNSEMIPNYMYIDVSRLGRTKSGINSATELHHTP